MNEVICEFCGTVYSEFEEKCPVCGASRGLDFEDDRTVQEDDFLQNMDILSQPQGEEVPPEPVKRNKQIFDFDQYQEDDEEEDDEDRYDDNQEAEDEDYSQYPEQPRTNMVLVAVLVIIIALLLLAVGFLFFRFFLPNVGSREESLPTLATEPIQTQATIPETTEPAIPCTDLSIPGGEIVLVSQGYNHLLNVRVFPEDTTDALTFVSADESIATVNHDGKITAQGEGETTITISCGKKSMQCKVLVDYSLATEPTEAETLPLAESPDEAAPAGAEGTDKTDAAQTEETAAPTEKSKLKLKKTDITLFARYVSYTIEMDCDIQPDQMDWITMDSTICIVIDGVITATGPGSTRVIGTYNGESVECVVRCNF